MHVLVMAMLLTVALMCLISRAGKSRSGGVAPSHGACILSYGATRLVFTGKLLTWLNFAPPLLATGLIWGIAMLKVRLARGDL